MKILIAIPSRIGSTRLPDKAILDINGKPMIRHVYDRAMESECGDVIVATDDIRIRDIIEMAGGIAIMTDPYLPSGTDRIYAAYKKMKKEYDIIINLQGDMPNVKPYVIQEVVNIIKEKKEADIATIVVKIIKEDDIKNPNIVKTAISFKENEKYQQAIYFSREAIPSNLRNENKVEYFHHLGIYGYTKNSLENFVNFKSSYLENCEKLEQLRALENGMKIYTGFANEVPISIDTKGDLEIARNIM